METSPDWERQPTTDTNHLYIFPYPNPSSVTGVNENWKESPLSVKELGTIQRIVTTKRD